MRLGWNLFALFVVGSDSIWSTQATFDAAGEGRKEQESIPSMQQHRRRLALPDVIISNASLSGSVMGTPERGEFTGGELGDIDIAYFLEFYPELEIDMDTIIAGGLLHDVGKAWEFDPENHKRRKSGPIFSVPS